MININLSQQQEKRILTLQESLANYSLTIFVVSTTGQGDFPADAKAFWKTLLLKRLPPTFLQSVNFVLFGLGDSSYPKYVLLKMKFFLDES
jgi:sulfite reductase alpha subunit-like flavoprotein